MIRIDDFDDESKNVLQIAYELLGDGHGEDWYANPEHTDGIFEMVAALVSVDPRDVFDLVRQAEKLVIR